MQAHTLIAEFATEQVARSAVDELTGLFAEHAREVDKAEEPDTWMMSNACRALAARYGFRWRPAEGLPFADVASGRFAKDLPQIDRVGRQVVVYSGFGAGFGDLPKYFTARGAVVQSVYFPLAKLTFHLPAGKAGDLLTGRLVRFFDQARFLVELDEAEVQPPWLRSKERWDPPVIVDRELVAWALHGSRFQLVLPATPRQVEQMRTWLAREGAKRVEVAYHRDEDRAAVREVREAIEVLEGFVIRWPTFEKLVRGATPAMEGKKVVCYMLELRSHPVPAECGLRHWDALRAIDGVRVGPSVLEKVGERIRAKGHMTLRIDRGPDPGRRLALRLAVVD